MRKNVIGLALCAMVFALSFPAKAQQPAKQATIAVLGAPEEPRFSEVVGGLKKGLGELGYTSQALQIIESKVARADEKAAKSIVEGLLKQRAQVLFLIGSRLLKPARAASAEVPIVFITPGDPVASGLVASLARPGSHTTAMTFEYPELSGKRLEVLKEMVPRIQRVLILYDPRDASPRQGAAAARETAPKLGMALLERETRNADEIRRGLDALGETDAFLAIPGGVTFAHYQEIVSVANARRKPTMFHAYTGSTLAGLASYGASDTEVARQAARSIDKILKGANAGELPVERPTKLELVINLKTAKQIGVTIPPQILARADRIIR
ncbi:MAG TPA: ABC transporter substrate-binding protein [Candidatus Binatia bacterium]|nr:ABC transporter substrate-binding protein [Candidatus Binatia bacterium]